MEKKINTQWDFEIVPSEGEIHIFESTDNTVAIATIYAQPLGTEEYERAKLICSIPELKQQLSSLQEQLNHQKGLSDYSLKEWGKDKLVISSLQADNERLRKALQKIDSATYAHKEWTDMHKVNHIATEALQNK